MTFDIIECKVLNRSYRCGGCNSITDCNSLPKDSGINEKCKGCQYIFYCSTKLDEGNRKKNV